MSEIIDVAAGLVFHQGRLLITQRPPHVHLAGLWEFPGGKLEPGETFEQGLIRELREELGIEVSIEREIEDITHTYPEKAVHLKFLFCRLLSGEARPLHCHDLAWISREQLGSYNFPAADAKLLQRLMEDLDLWQ